MAGVGEAKTAEAVSRGPRTGSAIRTVADDEQLEQPAGLLEQFYSTLRVTYLTASQERSPSNNAAHNMIDALFEEEPPSWRAAYQIEQLLTLVLTEEQLDIELKRRMAEAIDLHLPYANMLLELSNAASDGDDKIGLVKKRALLHRLLNDLQWFYSQRYQRRLAAETLAYRVSRLFLYTFIVFFLVLFVQLLNPQSSDHVTDVPRADHQENLAPTKPAESGS
jgi:hypothetical protein